MTRSVPKTQTHNTMKKRLIVLKLLAAAAAVFGVTSCSLLHNKNDWAMGKGSSPRYIPQQVGKSDGSIPVRGGK